MIANEKAESHAGVEVQSGPINSTLSFVVRSEQKTKWNMYIINTDSQERESEAIRRVLASFHKEYVLAPMGLGTLSWAIMEAQKPGLIPGVVGDLDILPGTMEFCDPAAFRDAFDRASRQYPGAQVGLLENLAGKEIAEAGGIKWPPEPSYVIGVEVKCSYFDIKPRSTKSSPEKVAGIRKQIEWLLKMGLDRVALLDVIANPPSDGVDSGAWLAASSQAQASFAAAQMILGDRLPADSSAGQFVWAVGPVVGGAEDARGAGGPILLRAPQSNPAIGKKHPEVVANRETLMASIPKLLGGMPRPRYFPIVYIDCRKCRGLHVLSDGCPGLQ